MLLLLLLGLALAVSGKAPTGTHTRAWSGRQDDTDGRLPTSLVPYHYNVRLDPDIYEPRVPPFLFGGHVDIYFECVEATNVITINNDGISIYGTTITIAVSPDSPGSPPVPTITFWEHVQTLQFLHFHLEDDLVVGGRYILSMSYEAPMKPPTQGQGLYWDQYQDENDQTVYIAATQFESIFTRMAVPSFDEPDFKATFNTTVIHLEHFKAFANTPIIRQTQNWPGGWVETTFAQTPVMSCYLLCIVVGDFVELYSGNDNGYEVRVWARPQLISQMRYAADIAQTIQAWLEVNTDYPYTLPKMDHIAVPSKGGAMENWGLITYGEESLVVNPETSPAYAVLNVGNIIAHELAHQWYGNLVTCKWWNEIWLNEGFANHFNYYPLETLGWDPSETQQADGRRGTQSFLDVDCKNDSVPVRKIVLNNWDADSAAAGSTYPKGAAIMRMMRGILSDDVLYAGLRRYLVDMQYKGATTDDLWRSLNAQAAEDGVTNPDGSALDIGARMDPWLNQAGFPLVTVTTGEGGTATLTRSHFLNPTNQVMDTPSPWNYAWDVPITVVTSQSPAEPDPWSARPIAWIDFDDIETTISDLPTGEADWFVINAQGLMFYRVHYDDQSRTAIINALNSDANAIEVQTKAVFIDDTFTLARAGILDQTDAMDTTVYLSDEFHYCPWNPTVKHLTSIDRLIHRQQWYSLYRTYIVQLTLPVYNSLGWVYEDTEQPIEQYLRRDIISLSCTNGWYGCVDAALQEYYAARNNPAANVVNANNLPTVLCVGGQLFPGDWDIWFDEYQNRKGSQVREERYAYLFGLACSTFQNNIFRYFDELLGPNIAPRDKNTAAAYLALNDYGAILLFNYLDLNWNAPVFSSKFTTLQTIVGTFTDETGLGQLQRFIDRHPPTSQTERNLFDQMILSVEQNIAWVAQNADSLRDWLQLRRALNPEGVAGGIHAPLSISPALHWKHVMDTKDDPALY